MQSYLDISVGTQRLAACLHRPTGADDAPIVVCCHGLTGTRNGSGYRFVALARKLVEVGIACLRFDFRGCGESDGRFIDVTSASLAEDLRAVLAAVSRLEGCDVNRLGIAASSFGAFTTARVAGDLSGLRGLVFLAPVADPRALIQQGMTPEAWDFLRKSGWVDHHGLPLGAGFIDTLPEGDAPRMLAATKAPLLIFHGTGDQQVPINQGEAYVAAMRAAGVESRLETIDTNDHGMRGVMNAQRIVEGSFQWLRERL